MVLKDLLLLLFMTSFNLNLHLLHLIKYFYFIYFIFIPIAANVSPLINNRPKGSFLTLDSLEYILSSVSDNIAFKD